MSSYVCVIFTQENLWFYDSVRHELEENWCHSGIFFSLEILTLISRNVTVALIARDVLSQCFAVKIDVSN